jgi:transcriptional regulator with XRE-family HTH domain
MEGEQMVRGRGSGITPPEVVKRLKEAVSEKSILAVSKATGLGLAAIGRYLKGVGEPTTKSLENLAKYFNCSVPELRGEELIQKSGRTNRDEELRGEDRYFSDGEISTIDALSYAVHSQREFTKMLFEAISSLSPDDKYHAYKKLQETRISLLQAAKALVMNVDPELLSKDMLQQAISFINEMANMIETGDEDRNYKETKKELLSLQEKFQIALDKK